MTIFKDQDTFMTACDQAVGSYNADQYELYINLITEEVNELATAIEDNDEVEQLDALNTKFLWDLMHDEVGVVWL